MGCTPCALARLATNADLAQTEEQRSWWSKNGVLLLLGLAGVAGVVALWSEGKEEHQKREKSEDRIRAIKRRHQHSLYGMKRRQRRR